MNDALNGGLLNQATDTVLYAVDNGIAQITLNRPGQANALDKDTVFAFSDAVNKACDDQSVRVIMLQANGKTFCAGGDITTFQGALQNLPELLDTLLLPLNKALLRLHTSGLPIVSVINGPVGGGGIGIALCADFVLAADAMKLRCGYSGIGLSPDAGSSWNLANRAGPTRAKQLFALNTVLDAQTCLQYGIVDAVYPAAELLDQAMSLAVQLCAGSKNSLARIKSLVDGIGQRSFQEHLELERQYMLASGAEPDANEGISAFTEKRTPIFK